MALVVLKDQDVGSSLNKNDPMSWADTVLYNRAYLQQFDNMPRNIITQSERVLVELMEIVRK